MNLDNEKLKFISKIHCSIPKTWLPDYRFSEKKVSFVFESMKDGLEIGNTFLSVTKDQNDIVSYIWAEVQDGVIFIRSLWTEHNYRNRGYAIKLKKELESWASKNKIKEIHTYVIKKNHSMTSLNKKFGYAILKETEHSFHMIKLVNNLKKGNET